MEERWLVLMHDDAVEPEDSAAWVPYLTWLRSTGRLAGGSSLGPGVGVRLPSAGVPGEVSSLVGYLMVTATSAEDARTLLVGNPVYDAGGTVELRPLVED